MPARLRDKPLEVLKPDEVTKLGKLTMGSMGSMYYQLHYLLDDAHHMTRKASRAVIVVEDGKVIGWALIFPEDGKKVAYFFIQPHYRRRGYGTHLARHIKRKYKKIRVCPWDQRSTSFFYAVGMK